MYVADVDLVAGLKTDVHGLDPLTAGSLKDLYQTTGIPERLIIDKNGIIIEKIIGPRNWASSGAIKYFREISQIN